MRLLNLQVLVMAGAVPAASPQMLHRSASVLHLRAPTERALVLRTAPQSLQALRISLARRRPNQYSLRLLKHQVRRLRAIRPLLLMVR